MHFREQQRVQTDLLVLSESNKSPTCVLEAAVNQQILQTISFLNTDQMTISKIQFPHKFI